MSKNYLYYGDNLDIMRRYIKDEVIDLVYLDPPFNSNRDYNVLFLENGGAKSEAQVKAFEDTWSWDEVAAESFQNVVEYGGYPSKAMQGFRTLFGESKILAYLSMMAPRLIELHRVLKPTGSIYLHCDPTMSHSLKILMDSIFGYKNFKAEIVWKRSSAHSDTKQGRRQHGWLHDNIYFYSKSNQWTWNPVYTPYEESYINKHYRHKDKKTGRRYRWSDFTGAKPGGDTLYDWRVKRRKNSTDSWEADLKDEWKNPRAGWEYKAIRPSKNKNRYWAYSLEKMINFEKEGRIYYSSAGMPNYKRYLDEMPGVCLQDVWTDIPPLGPGARERLGYPAQKPEALLERIIRASSNKGDLVLDPFCGCGTATSVSQKLGRKWIGIDITHLAISLIKYRLLNAFGHPDLFGDRVKYDVIGEPVTISDAKALAKEDPYQFQWWAVGLVGARPEDKKKGADKGIDGRVYFHDEEKSKQTKQIILSVKSGNVTVSQIRDLRGVVNREKAEIGVFICLKSPTKPMRVEASSAGFYTSPLDSKKYPKLQIITIKELLSGKTIKMPSAR